MLKGFFYSVLSSLGFGSMAILAKLGYAQGLSSGEMLRYRFGLGALILVVGHLLCDRPTLRIGFRSLRNIALFGAVLYPLQSTCYFRSLLTIPAATTSLILYIFPLTVTLLSAVFYGLKIDRVILTSLGLILAGCCLVFYNAFLQQVDPVGVAYALGAMCTFSCYMLLAQKLIQGENPRTVAIYVVCFAAVVFNVLEGLPDIGHMTSTSWTIAVGLGLLPTAMAVLALYKAIAAVGSAYTSIFSTLEPIATVLGAAWILGEPATTLQFAGMAGIVAGIVLPNLRLLRLGPSQRTSKDSTA